MKTSPGDTHENESPSYNKHMAFPGSPPGFDLLPIYTKQYQLPIYMLYYAQ